MIQKYLTYGFNFYKQSLWEVTYFNVTIKRKFTWRDVKKKNAVFWIFGRNKKTIILP